MDEKNRENIEYELADIITGEPQVIPIGHKQFKLYPVTLAKIYLLKRHVVALSINKENLKINPTLEALRLVNEKRMTCCHILAIHTSPNTHKDLFCINKSAERHNVFMQMSDMDLATLLIAVLIEDNIDDVVEYLELDKELERMRKVMEVKDSKNTINFGGKSIFGSFIGPLKEMGYTDNEILYERPYSFLRLMIADKINSVYLTDEELAKLPALTASGKVMDGNDPNATGKVLSTLANRGLKIKQ